MDSVGAHNYPVLGKRARLQNRIRALRVFGYRNNSLKIGSTKVNQKIRFKDRKKWWTVLERKKNGWTKVKHGKKSMEMTNSYRVLQKPFANL